jgi:hypothetical protein
MNKLGMLKGFGVALVLLTPGAMSAMVCMAPARLEPATVNLLPPARALVSARALVGTWRTAADGEPREPDAEIAFTSSGDFSWRAAGQEIARGAYLATPEDEATLVVDMKASDRLRTARVDIEGDRLVFHDPEAGERHLRKVR